MAKHGRPIRFSLHISRTTPARHSYVSSSLRPRACLRRNDGVAFPQSEKKHVSFLSHITTVYLSHESSDRESFHEHARLTLASSPLQSQLCSCWDIKEDTTRIRANHIPPLQYTTAPFLLPLACPFPLPQSAQPASLPRMLSMCALRFHVLYFLPHFPCFSGVSSTTLASLAPCPFLASAIVDRGYGIAVGDTTGYKRECEDRSDRSATGGMIKAAGECIHRRLFILHAVSPVQDTRGSMCSE